MSRVVVPCFALLAALGVHAEARPAVRERPQWSCYRSFNKEFPAMKRFADAGIVTRCFTLGNTENSAGNPYCQYPVVWKDDVLPPKAKIVDGYEYGYRFDSQKREYYFGYALQKSRYSGHAEASNRAKYVAQVSSASAIYLDRYVNPETSRWYAAPLNGSRTARFAADVAQATHVSDDYVWFWGERHGWTGGKRKTWEEVLPGMSDAMRLARDSRGFAAERLALLKRTGRYAPLNANVECRQAAGSADGCLSKPYSGWSDTAVGDAGRFGFDSAVGENDGSSLVAEGVAGGCLVMTSKPVVPGKAYIVGFSAKGDLVGGSVEWQRDGKWDFSIPGLSVPLSAPDANGWRHGITAIRIPENANGFGLQLQVRQAPGERSWFDNVFYCDAE